MWIINKAPPAQQKGSHNSRVSFSPQLAQTMAQQSNNNILSQHNLTPELAVSQQIVEQAQSALARSPSSNGQAALTKKELIQQQYSPRHRALKARFEIIQQQQGLMMTEGKNSQRNGISNKKQTQVIEGLNGGGRASQNRNVKANLEAFPLMMSNGGSGSEQSINIQSPPPQHHQQQQQIMSMDEATFFSQQNNGFKFSEQTLRPSVIINPSNISLQQSLQQHQFKLPQLGFQSPPPDQTNGGIIYASSHYQSIYQPASSSHHNYSIKRPVDKGAEMFAMTIKQKEVDFQARLMENRLKKLQDEEERTLKKINQTIQRTQRFEKIKEIKDDHKKRLQDFKLTRDIEVVEARKKFTEDNELKKRRIELAYQSEMQKKRSARGVVDEVLSEVRRTVKRQNSKDMEHKKEINTQIRHGINGGISLRREESSLLKEEMAEKYRQRNETIKHTIRDKLYRIDEMENKEMLLMQRLQATVKLKEDIRLNYAKLTGLTPQKSTQGKQQLLTISHFPASSSKGIIHLRASADLSRHSVMLDQRSGDGDKDEMKISIDVSHHQIGDRSKAISRLEEAEHGPKSGDNVIQEA